MDSNAHDTNDRAALREVFVQEAETQLDVLEQLVLGLEASPTDIETLNRVFRAAHTIKGGALMVELDGIGRLAHFVEDVLHVLRSGEREADSEVISLLLDATDGLGTLVEAVAGGDQAEIGPYEPLCAALRAWVEAGSSETVDAPRATEAVLSPTPSGDDEGARASKTRRSLRVEIGKLDRLLEAVSELAIQRQTLGAQIRDTVGDVGSRIATRALLEAHTDGDRFVDELREAVLSLRLVPLAPEFRRFGRAVRDAALASGKEAVLEVDAESVELDMSIAEQLVEPLTHLIRNAVDHGIEPAEEREGQGKPRAGTVRIGARRDGGNVVIEVSDDGGGFPRAALERGAREWGVPRPDELTDAELQELVFQPGFSTSEQVTDLSGRGVGMDAVRGTVEAMRGSVEIRSQEGVGTLIAIRVPLTLASIRGLEVEVGDNAYILPMESVKECVGVSDIGSGPGGILAHDGRAIPLVDLRDCFGRGPGDGVGVPAGEIVLVEHGRQIAALVVDRVRGELETVMRPMASPLARIPGVGGSALLADGRIGLVVDVPGLIRDVAKWEAHEVPA